VGGALIYSLLFLGVALPAVVVVRLLTWWWTLLVVRSAEAQHPRRTGAHVPHDFQLLLLWLSAGVLSGVFARTVALLWKAEWLPPALLSYGLLCAWFWHLARDSGERKGGSGGAVFGVLGTAFCTFTLMVALRRAHYPVAPTAPVYLAEASVIAFVFTTALWVTARLASLPRQAVRLRRGGRRAAAQTWIPMLLLWAVFYYLAPVLHAIFAPQQRPGDSLPGIDTSCIETPAGQALCHALFLGTTAVMVLCTIMRQERVLARLSLDWGAWTRTQWSDYVLGPPMRGDPRRDQSAQEDV
jgi:hypothetical protein